MTNGNGEVNLPERLLELRRGLKILDQRTDTMTYVFLRDPKTGELVPSASAVSHEIIQMMLSKGRLEYVDAKGGKQVVLFGDMPEQGRKRALQRRLEEKFTRLGYRLDADGKPVNLPRIEGASVTQLELLLYPVEHFATWTLTPGQKQARHEKHQARNRRRAAERQQERREGMRF